MVRVRCVASLGSSALSCLNPVGFESLWFIHVAHLCFVSLWFIHSCFLPSGGLVHPQLIHMLVPPQRNALLSTSSTMLRHTDNISQSSMRFNLVTITSSCKGSAPISKSWSSKCAVPRCIRSALQNHNSPSEHRRMLEECTVSAQTLCCSLLWSCSFATWNALTVTRSVLELLSLPWFFDVPARCTQVSAATLRCPQLHSKATTGTVKAAVEGGSWIDPLGATMLSH